MAYIVGQVSYEEAAELKRRGWKLEKPPNALIADDEKKTYPKTVMVWVDNNMLSIMSGPGWQK